MAEEEYTTVQMAIDTVKIIFAVSPLIVLFYVVFSGFDSEEEEARKRNKKGDFRLDGHAE